MYMLPYVDCVCWRLWLTGQSGSQHGSGGLRACYTEATLQKQLEWEWAWVWGSQGAPCWNHLAGKLELELAWVSRFQGVLHQGHYGRLTGAGQPGWGMSELNSPPSRCPWSPGHCHSESQRSSSFPCTRCEPRESGDSSKPH